MHPSSITAYAFFCNKQPTSTSVVAPLHPSWRELLPPQSTSITLDTWRYLLQWHPDKFLVDTVLDAVEWGRAVHYTGARLASRTSARNSPDEHLVTLRQLRAAEFKAGWRAGPFPPPLPLFNLICNPTKLVLKGSKPRHVVDSSSPHDGTSVNANIDRSQTRLFNTSFAQLATLIVHEGPAAELIKFDVVSAYKLVRLLWQDLHLLGEQELIGGVLHHSFSLATSFGSASSADNFHDLAEVIEFLIRLLATLLSSLARYADTFVGSSRAAPCMIAARKLP